MFFWHDDCFLLLPGRTFTYCLGNYYSIWMALCSVNVCWVATLWQRWAVQAGSGLEGGRYRTGRSRQRAKAYRLYTAPLTMLQFSTPVSLTDPQTTVPPQPAFKWPSFRVKGCLEQNFPHDPPPLPFLTSQTTPSQNLGSRDTLHSLATLGRLLSRSGFNPEISWLAVFI